MPRISLAYLEFVTKSAHERMVPLARGVAITPLAISLSLAISHQPSAIISHRDGERF